MISMIAIDGPASSGKTTLGKKLSDELGFLFFDTGVMYRAVTLAAIERSIPIEDETSVTALAEEIHIDIRQPSIGDGRPNDVIVDGVDQTWAIRQPEVEANVSEVSAYQGVRKALTEKQRAIGLRGNVVMVGRDIGTVVLPEADLKIYLVASMEERARRRYKECVDRGEPVTFDTVFQAMQLRDKIDSTREYAPLQKAKDAFTLDSDDMDIDQVYAFAISHIKGLNEDQA
ncbi:MAG: (d)CMP kinase [Anaerolineales bacterium]